MRSSAAGAPRDDARIRIRSRTIDRGLDRIFAPWGWAATLAHHVGLQGRLRTNRSTIVIRDGAASTPAPSLRIAFGSDFHAGPTTHPSLLSEACKAFASFEPDVLLLGGDFVSVRASYVDELAHMLARVRAPLGKFAVLGNHDLRADTDEIIDALDEAGVSVLRNENRRLPAPHDDVWICGLDDPIDGHPRADLTLDGATGVRIVVMHAPDGLLEIGEREFAIALCGHTHGGQVSLPTGTPIVVPEGKLNRRYPRGHFHVGGSDANPRLLIVSRGVGCSAIPIRLFSPPEVHLFVLERSSPIAIHTSP